MLCGLITNARGQRAESNASPRYRLRVVTRNRVAPYRSFTAAETDDGLWLVLICEPSLPAHLIEAEIHARVENGECPQNRFVLELPFDDFLPAPHRQPAAAIWGERRRYTTAA